MTMPISCFGVQQPRRLLLQACESDETLARAGHIVQAFQLDTEMQAVQLCEALRHTLKCGTNLFV
jgi:hypothetical protein